MGTFHDGKGELHGITVVVDTVGPEIFVGRCDEVNAKEVILLDADVHREGEEERSKEEYVQRAARFGVWKRYDRLAIPRRAVTSVRRLGSVRSPY